MPDDEQYMDLAYEQAKKSYDEGGLPIGAILVEEGEVVGRGHNQRVQSGDPTAHGEMDCLRNVGRRASYRSTVLYTTLSPCMMCAGTIVQFKIPSVVIGEDENFAGNVDFLRERGIDVVVLGSKKCTALMGEFIRDNPALWREDIAE